MRDILSPAKPKKGVFYMVARRVLGFKLKRSTKQVSAHAGLILFTETIKALKVDEEINLLMPKSLSNRGYGAFNHALTLMLTMYGGGVGIAETREIKNDLALKNILDLY